MSAAYAQAGVLPAHFIEDALDGVNLILSLVTADQALVVAEAAAALQVDHPPAQDAPEQRRPLGGRLVGVVQHAQQRVLYRIQRVVTLAQAGLGEAEGARPDAGQECFQRGRNGVGIGG